jgi:hypothetical protein
MVAGDEGRGSVCVNQGQQAVAVGQVGGNGTPQHVDVALVCAADGIVADTGRDGLAADAEDIAAVAVVAGGEVSGTGVRGHDDTGSDGSDGRQASTPAQLTQNMQVTG